MAKKELNEEALEQVTGGSYVYDRTNHTIYLGSGTNVVRFNVPSNLNPDDVSALLIGACTTGNDDVDTQNMLKALTESTWGFTQY